MKRSFMQPGEKHAKLVTQISEHNLCAPEKMEDDNSKIHRSQQSQSTKSVDFDDLLTMELDQVKHQNQFLKKKLHDAIREKRQLLMQGFGVKPKRSVEKRPKRHIEDNIQLSLDFFFKQINNLINNVRDIFKVALNHQEER